MYAQRNNSCLILSENRITYDGGGGGGDDDDDDENIGINEGNGEFEKASRTVPTTNVMQTVEFRIRFCVFNIAYCMLSAPAPS